MMYFENGHLSATDLNRSSYSLRDLFNPALLGMLPPDKQDGSIFAKSTDLTQYLQIYFGSFLFFAAVFQMWKGLFTAMKHPNFVNKDY